MNELTEFEERNATIAKEWEQDLKSVKEKTIKNYLKTYQTLKLSWPPVPLILIHKTGIFMSQWELHSKSQRCVLS